jgi:hypothetical protein
MSKQNLWDVWIVDFISGTSFKGWESVSLKRASWITSRWPDKGSSLVLLQSGIDPRHLLQQDWNGSLQDSEATKATSARIDVFLADPQTEEFVQVGSECELRDAWKFTRDWSLHDQETGVLLWPSALDAPQQCRFARGAGNFKGAVLNTL